MPISTKLFNDQAIMRFNRLTSDIQNTQGKIATGKNLLRASDDPVAAANISFTRDQKVMLERYSTNIDRAQMRLTMAENILGNSVNLMTRAYELALQARNDTLSALDREAIGQEITQIKEMLVGIANSRDANGDYLFSGYKVGDVPFVRDSNNEIQYMGDNGQHTVQISEGLNLRTGAAGSELFLRVDTASGVKDVFTIIEALESDLQSGIASGDSIDELDASLKHFSIQRTKLGAELNKADMQKAALERRVMLMDENLSTMEDADLASLVTKLQSQMVSRDAAQQAFVKVGQQSLFDYIR